MKLRILYCGVEDGTCRHRGNALVRLGHNVNFLDYQYPRNRWLYRLKKYAGLDVTGINSLLQTTMERNEYDVVWFDKCLDLHHEVLRRMRKHAPYCKFVHYSPDDMFNPQNSTSRYVACIPWYDLHVTTKSYNVRELRDCGAQGVLFVDNAYEPTVHRPIVLTEKENAVYQADVGFLGAHERERAEMLMRLAQQGIRVKVWGGGDWSKIKSWHPNLRIEPRAVLEEEYAKAICGMQICLTFLRKVNRDLQTTRTMEIPACGAFMLAERTDEHLRLFEEGVEAAFFSSFEELFEKCRYYLAHEEERQRIAQAGYQRCLRDGYSNDHRMKQALDYLFAQAALG